MKPTDRPRCARQPRRPWLAVALIAAGCLLQGCQWLQNEFFYLDRAAPSPPLPKAGEHPLGGD